MAERAIPGSAFRLLNEMPGLEPILSSPTDQRVLDVSKTIIDLRKTFLEPAQYFDPTSAPIMRRIIDPLIAKYPDLDTKSVLTQAYQGTVSAKIARDASSGGFLGDIGRFFSEDIGRILSGVFTVGLSEISINDRRLGETLRLDPFFSGQLSGGNIVTGATSETEREQFGLAFKAGTAVAGVSAMTAGTEYSLSGGLDKLVSTPTGLEGVSQYTVPAGGIIPTSGGKLETSAFAGLFGQAYTTIGEFFGNVGQSFLRVLSGDIVGGLQQLVRPILGGDAPQVRGGLAPRAAQQGGGSFGGGGSFSDSATQQVASSPWLVGVAVGMVALIIFLIVRKR